LIKDLNELKRENRKKAEEKAAKTDRAVSKMFGDTSLKKFDASTADKKSKVFGNF
jgi:hypothetical protein